MRRSARSVISTLSPVSLISAGMSITDNGSVQCTSRKSPGGTVFSALRVFNAVKGHLSPLRSSFVVAISATWRTACGSSIAGNRLSDQAAVGEKPDGLAGFDPRDLLTEFDQAVGIDQRRQQACAFARKFDCLGHAIGTGAETDPDVLAARDLFLVGEGGANRHRHQRLLCSAR